MDEKSLINQAKNGDTNSFSKLVILHQDSLYQYLLARCHNPHDASDVLQDTFINAFKYLKSYKEKWKFKSWLFTISSRLIKKQKTLYSTNVNDKVIEETDEIAEIVINKNNVWNKIQSLVKKETFDVLWFYYIEEYSTKEIAQIMQQSQSWVKIALYRSRKKLAKNKDILELSKDYLMVGIKL